MLKVMQKLKIGSAVGLGIAGLVVLPNISFAHAESNTATMDLNANVAAAGLSVTLGSSSTTLNLAPPYTGYTNQSSQVKVEVGSYDSYKLYMTGSTNLVNQSDNTKVISPISTTCNTLNSNAGCLANDDTNFTNAWGYSVGQTDPGKYKGLYGYSVVGNRTTSTQEQISDSYYVNFITKVDHTVTPGTYTGTINFIALADVSKTYMQFMNASECANTANNGAPLTVYDSRDGTSYKVQQLADGKCWMLDNLALDPTADNGNGGTVMDNMNSLNTNASDQSIAILKGGASTIEGLDNSSKKYASAGITNTWKQNIITASGNPTMWTDHRLDSDWEDKKSNYTDNWTVPRINNSRIDVVPLNSNNEPAIYGNTGSNKTGVYYNYCSASAGTYCYDGPVYSASSSTQGVASTMTGSPDTEDAAKATYDICPKGWSMPTGGNSGEFRDLYKAYGGSATGNENNVAFKTALSTPLSGYVNYSSGAVVNVGAGGGWWSSTRYFASGMYYLDMSASSAYPADSYYRSAGFSIRCVLRNQ